MIDRIVLENLQMRLEYWILTEMLVWSTLAQLATIVTITVLAWLTARALKGLVKKFMSRHQLHEHNLRSLARALVELMFPITAMLLLWAAIEDLITQRVVNWSFSSERHRLAIPFGISYDSYVRLAMNLAIQAALDVSRVLKEPPPACRLIGFGESSIDFELRLWINDPASGVANVRSAVLLGMWDRFMEQRVKIPFPQRDIQIRDGNGGVTLHPGRGGAAV